MRFDEALEAVRNSTVRLRRPLIVCLLAWLMGLTFHPLSRAPRATVAVTQLQLTTGIDLDKDVPAVSSSESIKVGAKMLPLSLLVLAVLPALVSWPNRRFVRVITGLPDPILKPVWLAEVRKRGPPAAVRGLTTSQTFFPDCNSRKGKTMKKAMCVAMLLSLVAASAFGAEDKGLIPIMKVGDNGTLKLQGFGQVAFTDSLSSQADDGLAWTNLRLRSTLTLGHWEFGNVVNFADFQEPDGNWLRELYVGYKLDDNWKLCVGRLFIAAGYSTPAPFDLETVEYPFADPFDCYAYGVQLSGKFNDQWSLMASLSGNSGKSFSDSENFERLELSAMLTRSFESGSLSGICQVSEDFGRYAIVGAWQPASSVSLRGEVNYVDNARVEESNRFGAYVFAAYRPVSWLEIHTQVDTASDLQKSYWQWQTAKADDGSVSVDRVEVFTSNEKNAVWTQGLRFLIGKDDLFSIAVDHETVIDGDRDDRFLVRGQLKF